eukprot:scaffold21_cov107-Cylindrotheca_fusiformis.AAC.5
MASCKVVHSSDPLTLSLEGKGGFSDRMLTSLCPTSGYDRNCHGYTPNMTGNVFIVLHGSPGGSRFVLHRISVGDEYGGDGNAGNAVLFSLDIAW